MRRFLDWTAAQTAGGLGGQSNTTTSSSHHRRGSSHQINTPSHQLATSLTPCSPAKDQEIQHLTQLLHEIKYYQASSSPLPSAIGSQNQREFVDKVYTALPLFLNVFGSNLIQHASVIGSTSYIIDEGSSQSLFFDDLSHSESNLSSKPSSPLPPRSPQMERFPELLPFSFTIARLFVSEVRQRASNKHAEDASLAILQYLNAKPASTTVRSNSDKLEDSSSKTADTTASSVPDILEPDQTDQGWILLLSLNTLANSTNTQIIQSLCDASLPSTLIKCLYLFFDLPLCVKSKTTLEVDRDRASKGSQSSETTTTSTSSTRDLVGGPFVKAFTQLLVQLCSHQAAIDELIKKDDLRLLVGIASSQCLPHNRSWRKTAFQTLMAISKNMKDNFMYLEQNLCIQVYVENMQRVHSLGLVGIEDFVDMIRVLLGFLYNLDVNNRNQPRSIGPLIEQFKSSRILELIEELIFKIDDTIMQELNQLASPASASICSEQDPFVVPMSQQPSVSSEPGINIDDFRRQAKQLVHSITTMAKIHFSQELMIRNTTLKPLTMSRFEMLEQFKMPRPSAKDCILNNEALRLFKLAWSKCRDSHIIEAILDATISLFNDDKYNYFIFESEQLLVYYMSSSNFNQFPCKIKQKLFKFLEFIIIETNYIPCLELGTLGTIIKSKTTSDTEHILALKTLIACLRLNSKFSDIFREIGLLEVIIDMLIETMQDAKLSQLQDKLEILYSLLEASQYLLAGPNNQNCTQFNESGASRYVFNCLSKPKFFRLFVPPHSSSSDDGGAASNASRNSTPTPTGISKSRQGHSLINAHWLDTMQKTMARPSIKHMQKVAFTIIRQLILSNAGDEHLANLLGLLARNIDDLKSIEEHDDKIEGDNQKQASDLTFLLSQEVNLKIYILKSLMIILKDSHRCRTLFRKVGGFIYIVSSLNSLESSLPPCEAMTETQLESYNRWKKINSRRVWRLIKNSFMTIVVAMRAEPSNVNVFSDDVMPKFTDAIRRLGCFNSKQTHLIANQRTQLQVGDFDYFKSIFLSPPTRDFSTISNDNMLAIDACCQLFRFLYDMSLDMADGTFELEEQLYEESFVKRNPTSTSHHDTKSISFDQGSSESSPHVGIFKRRSQLQKSSAKPPSLDLNTCSPDPAILTFPCIVLSMLDLIPSCPNDDLMSFICMIIKSVFKHERNQQMLCEAGMISKLLEPQWQITIMDKGHFLHSSVVYMFEKLTRQTINSRELRLFLRLGNPLCCKNIDEIEVSEIADENFDNQQGINSLVGKNYEKISSDRIGELVAMMNDERIKNQPPIIEFDMSSEGCSSIFMPSIAPVNAKLLPNSSPFLNSTLDIHTSEKNGILGGVGSKERKFPPSSGLTFSTWIRIEKFPVRSPDANHNIRLLTIYRGSASTGKEYSCFRIQVSALDRALTVSTQEVLLFDNENRQDTQQDPDCYVRVWTPETLIEGRWHHIAIAMSKPTSRQSNVHIYVDGTMVHNQRICYISDYVGSLDSGPLGNTGPSGGGCLPAAFVNAFIGPLPQYRLQLKTRWCQGPCHLVEEHLGANFIAAIHALGPSYIGNFQSTYKMSELAKIKPIRGDAKYHQSPDNHHHQHHHKPIAHQQSISFVQSSPRHGASLNRVSSSGMASSAASQVQQINNNLYIPEDRILMNLDARATSLLTLSRMRKIYTRFDCRQISRVLGLSMHENSMPILLLHNTGIHLNGPSCGIGAVTIGHGHVRCFVPSPTEQTLFNIGGSYVLLGLVAQAQSANAFYVSLKALTLALINNPRLQSQMDNINGYQILTVFFWKKKHLLSPEILSLIFSLITDSSRVNCSQKNSNMFKTIQQTGALRDLICENFDLWLQVDMINVVLEFIHDLISSSNNDHQSIRETGSNSSRTKNLKCLRDLDLLPRMLRLLPRDSEIKDCPSESTDPSNNSTTKQTFDTKAIYLIKQTVFELLNKTPRQADILHFGQYLASLLPADDRERSQQTINLRNVLLKSLLQMMTKNKQKEVNHAMQEELVRILGFDWFLLFLIGPHLDPETITLGFLNLMMVLSNDDLYANFKNNTSTNGGWLKEPTFPTIDGKFNIQLLGINVGVFLGLSGKRKAMCQEVLEAPNFLLLSSCVSHLVNMPRIYLMIFLTMMGRLDQLDSTVFDTICAFDKINLDILCDCLIGETHHKRRQTLSSIKFRSLELIVIIIHMIKTIMAQYGADSEEQVVTRGSDKLSENYPTDIVRFFMYLYNNNPEFQNYCKRSEDLIDGLSEALMLAEDSKLASSNSSYSCSKVVFSRRMTNHPASKEVLELSRLIILDRMTEIFDGEVECPEQLQTFEKFLELLATCKEAQGELVDMLLRQILLMIDSTARHNSTKTISGSENVQQFQLLLINSILVAQIVTDKIWTLELYPDNLTRISTVLDHQLCLAEQIFKFNEILPRNNPSHAFIMQRVLNRILLFVISRPLVHVSDKLLMLDLLKKIYDNRTIIILNHMHSPQSAEFFVCFTYWLMRIMEDNITSPSRRLTSHQTVATDQPASLIERQYGHPSPSRGSMDNNDSCSLMLVSLARKVWDAIYQSKKGLLSEAFDVSMSLPAFTLETSLDLIQLKPDIIASCEKYWSNFLESERRPKRKITSKQRESEPTTTGPASTAVNILSGRLTRVVNAASFVSRVVGATAGSMASNVNLTQARGPNKMPQRSPSDLGTSGNYSASHHQTQQAQQHPSQGVQPNAQSPSSGSSSSNNNNKLEMANKHILSSSQIVDAHRTHITIIEDYIKSQVSQKNHKVALHKYLCDEWLDIEYEILLRERALFGPDYGSVLDKWCLDLTEGPRRMRKKMVNNTKQFYEHYPYKPDEFNPNNKSMRYRPPMSYDSLQYFKKTINLNRALLFSNERTSLRESKPLKPGETEEKLLDEDGNQVPGESRNLTSTPTNGVTQQDGPEINIDSPSPVKSLKSQDSRQSIESLTNNNNNRPSPSSPEPSDCDQDDGDSTSFVDFSPEIEAETNSARESENTDSLSVLRLLEKNERISHMFRCSRVQGLDTYEGLLLFGREHFYLIDGFTLLKTREIKDIDSLPPDAHDPIIPNSTPNILAHSKKTCAKFSYDRVVEVHKRRYLLQPIALEVFSSDGRNTLIAFPRNIRNKVYSRLMSVATQITNNAQESLAGQKSNVSVESGSGLLSNLIGETSVTQRWVRGELSNFQYLMNLNTIAGRSYNDLMQYPIFPWILADYTSDQLDLTKASTFRDLSRPVGAQTSDRLEQFKRRYAEWDDTETPPYHYGTFYSSAMIVASYMVRMEPFTQHFLRLQGGHFDLADRMFHSINDSWMSASKHNMADIKELVPEFFYLPEFLRNENKYDLGIKQNGQRLDDVILPPWAKNDAREFIRLHRCALESDYVSAHLHEWIDLIFGYKQQGQPAIDAVNVFHHLFYEGNVDIYNTDIDPIKKNAVIGFINNFGQVPKQLFKKPHPARKVTSSHYIGGSGPMPLTPILPSLSVSSAANLNQRVLTHCPQLLHASNTVFKDLRGPVGQIVQVDKNIVAVEQNKLLIPNEYCRYIAWGHADRSLRLGLYESEKPIFVWEGSENLMPNEILCCTIPNSRTMITAGTESLITVWKIDKMRSFTPATNLYGHVEPVTCLASSQSYSLIVSGSRDKTAIIWDLNRLTFVRQLGGGPKDKLVHHGPISAIAINDSTGDIATCALSWLYLWTINGELLAHIDSFNISIQQTMGLGASISSNMNQIHILSVCFSQYNEWDSDEVIVTGSSDGTVALWSMRYYQCPMEKSSQPQESLETVNKPAVTTKQIAQELTVESESKERNRQEASVEQVSGASNEANADIEPQLDSIKPNTNPSSEPIAIRGQRQRTDTMNSEWVRLSTSSASTAEAIPHLNATPTSPMSDLLTSSDFMASGESCTTRGNTITATGQSPGNNPDQPSPELLGRAETPTKYSVDGPMSSSPMRKTPTEQDNLPIYYQPAFATNPGDRTSLDNLSLDTKDHLDGQSASRINQQLTPNDLSLLKFSKSDTSLVDSFVILDDPPASGAGGYQKGSSQKGSMRSTTQRPQSSNDANHPSEDSAIKARRRFGNHPASKIDSGRHRFAVKLQPNHVWRRELYLRMTLPRRQCKALPVAVTSLAISKDHRILYVGDASGHITAWTTT